MARRRMINPNVWAEEPFGALTYRQRLLKFGLTTMSDDEGRFRANPALIRAQVFPYDDLSLGDVEADLEAVARAGYVMLYERDGQRFGWEIEWSKDQKPAHPSPSELPPPPIPLAKVETNTPVLPFTNDSRAAPESFANDSRITPESFRNESGLIPEQVSHGQSSLGKDRVVIGQVSGRLTVDDTDTGAFSEVDIWNAYHRLTGNQPNERDSSAMKQLAASGFSSAALVRLFGVIKAKHGSGRIGSLSFFASSIEELQGRISRAQQAAARTSVGASDEEKQALRFAAIAREIQAWASGALELLTGTK